MLLQSPTPAPDLHLPPSNWRNPVVIGLIGAICTIFLLLSYYKIFKRHCFSLGEAPMLRHRTERRLINETNTDEPSLQFQSRALDSSILYSLPTIQYRKKSEGENEHGETETDCAVCLGEFQDGDWLRFLPNCTHSFHISCIDTWFESHSNCPLCRSNIIYSLADHHHGYSVSMLTLLETQRREDDIREAAGGGGGSPHIVVHSESLQNSTATVRPLQPIPTQT